MRSGHSTFSRSSSSSSAYAVVLKNHCSRFFDTTSAPQYSQRPSCTCSFASTTWSTGHHLTGEPLRYAEPRPEQLQEEPLVPAVVLGLVRRDQAVPVEAPAHPLHRRDDVRDVALDDRARVTALADRGVLGRQAERVEAHRVQDVHAVPPAEPRENVADRVDEDVPHVQRPGRIRPHLEHVALVVAVGLRLRIRDVERPCVLPDALPLRLDRLRVVPFHQSSRDKKASRKRGRGEPTRRCRAYLPDLCKQPLHRRSMLAIPGCWSYSHIRPVSRTAS